MVGTIPIRKFVIGAMGRHSMFITQRFRMRIALGPWHERAAGSQGFYANELSADSSPPPLNYYY